MIFYLSNRHALRLILVAAVCAAATTGTTGCNVGTASSAAQVTTATAKGRPTPSLVSAGAGGDDVATVQVITVDDPLVLPAQLYVDHDVVIAAQSSGVLQHLDADLGKSVAAGAVLANIDSGDQRIAVAKAEAAVTQASRFAKRLRALSYTGGVTVADSESAEFAVRQAGLSADSARRALALTRVTAPFAGVIAARYVGPYRLVHVGDTLFRITETGPLLARVRVPEGRRDALVPGARATVEDIEHRTVAAHVIRVAPTVDAASGTREVILAVGSAAGLRPGSAVTVRLGAATRRVTVVPNDLIGEGGYVVVLGAQPTLRQVRLGDELAGGRREVLSGLAPGNRVRRPDR
ncbi:MAG TPA: efflux RND transporter periplasmic adaptor subunit [Gemmatimonadaceae bacterium]|nr:efflux RND transporter periplasmic adaptor subunit [Gemmatimonadaceae bacterium]